MTSISSGACALYQKEALERARTMADEKKKCSDCACCQSCSKDRCRLCRRGAAVGKEWKLGRAFTYGAYLEWKDRQENGKDAGY